MKKGPFGWSGAVRLEWKVSGEELGETIDINLRCAWNRTALWLKVLRDIILLKTL